MAERATVWVCRRCGKWSKDRATGTEGNGWDVSCITNSVECYLDSLRMSQHEIPAARRVLAATAVAR